MFENSDQNGTGIFVTENNIYIEKPFLNRIKWRRVTDN